MRLFDEHIKRKTFLLDGMWELVTDEKDVGEQEEWYKHFPENAMQVTVPGCLNNRFGYMQFQSIAWYKKDFFAKGAVNIRFDAVTEYAKVYLDGVYLGDHYGSFTAFSFDAVLEEGMHTLIVRVDGRSTEDTIPLWEVDWHHYCGFLRGVEVSCFESIAVKSVRAEYTLSDDLTRADMKLYIRLKNYAAQPSSRTLSVDVDGEEVYSTAVTVAEEEQLCVETTLEQVRLWDLRKPELYTLTIRTEDDDLIEKIGLRKIEVKGKEILLNHKPIKVLGVNRHEEHPDWGFAMPPMLNAKDMDILKDLNVNAVRGSHYPNTQLFVDMCDAEGILFWSEIPMWGFKAESLARPLVISRGLEMHTEMVEQYYNHPSIVIWGLHNEVATDTEEGRSITKTFLERLRSLDGSRLLTYTTNRALKDICFDLADIICINQYVGWYGQDIEDWADWVVKMKNYLKELGVDGKPVIMSEFGVGAMFGCKTFEELRWSENYQVEFYKHTLDIFLNDPYFSGVYLWQFADIRSNAKWSLLRARSFNNKGLVNEYRQPKLGYYAVKEIFGNERNKGSNC